MTNGIANSVKVVVRESWGKRLKCRVCGRIVVGKVCALKPSPWATPVIPVVKPSLSGHDMS
jgi:hypothetical protein